MRMLLCYEFKKLFLKPSIIIILIFLLFVDVIRINMVYKEKGLFSEQNNANWRDAYWDCYEEYGGKITKEKAEQLNLIYENIKQKIADHTLSTNYDKDSYTYNAYSDEIFFRWCLWTEYFYDYDYEDFANEIVSTAKKHYDRAKKSGNDYMCWKQVKIANVFAGRKIDEYQYTEKYFYFLQYDFSCFLLLLFFVYALSSVFVIEKETEMDLLLTTTSKGGHKTALAKLITSCLLVISVSILFWITDYIAFSIMFKSFSSNHAWLYSLENFKHTPLNLNLIQYTLLSDAIKTFGLVVFSMFFILLSAILRKILYVLIAASTTAYLILLSYDFLPYWIKSIVEYINPTTLLQNRSLFTSTIFVNVFGYPLPAYILTLLCETVLAIILIFLIFKSCKKNQWVKLLGRKTVRWKY